MNSLDELLKFTMEIGGTSINFLDLTITIVENQLHTTVYSKPTDSHLYLQADSCHKKSSINGIQKGVALRLRRICSSTEEFDNRAKEYIAYLVARGHDPKSVLDVFKNARILPRSDARKKKIKNNSSNKVILSTKYNPRGPDVENIIKKHIHLIDNTPSLKKVLPSNSIMVAFKREKNLKELLLRGDPYNIKLDLTQNFKLGYKRCDKRCDSCDNFVLERDHIISNATGKCYTIKRDSSCSSKYVVYCAFCMKCGQQGIGSTVIWKPRLANYKSHIKKKIPTCKIVRHFIEECIHENDPLGFIKFIIIDRLNNTENLSSEQIDTMLLEKEKFWIGALVTQHKGMNSTHDWNRTRRNDKINK